VKSWEVRAVGVNARARLRDVSALTLVLLLLLVARCKYVLRDTPICSTHLGISDAVSRAPVVAANSSAPGKRSPLPLPLDEGEVITSEREEGASSTEALCFAGATGAADMKAGTGKEEGEGAHAWN